MTGFSEKSIVIDGRGHLLGRIASIVAKVLLNGSKVSIIRCEEINISGSFFRSKLKFMSFLRKRCNVNPARGPFHHRAPAKIMWKTIRGMVPHKIKRGQDALRRLKTYDGCPPKLEHRRRVCIPRALRILCLRPGRKYCTVGRLSHEVGWKYRDVVSKLESKRRVRTNATVAKAKRNQRLAGKANESVAEKTAPAQSVIESYGYH